MLGSSPAQMSDTQQKIVPMGPYVAVLAIDPLHLSEDLQINVRSVLEQIRPDMPPDATLEQILNELPGRFKSAAGVPDDRDSEITLRIVGYSEKERSVKVMLLEGLSSESRPLHSTKVPGLDWFGYVDIASRLVRGVSQLKRDDAPGPETISEYIVPAALMSLDDALNLAETLVDVTATFGKFVRGVTVDGEPQFLQIPVGGRIQSAVVRSDGFHWVKEPVWAVKPPRFPEPGE